MDESTWTALLAYAAPTALVFAVYAWRRARRSRRTQQAVERARADGLATPASVHPWIDPARCLGCGLCVTACPESGVLGLVRGKAVMVQAANCVGHGACKEACPTDAIALVLGTAEQGVEVPALDPHFETSVPGLFVAGELGGMGLIRNAIEQGRQVIESVRRRGSRGGDGLDVVIVGAGPAGFAATLAAHERGLRYRTLEQDCLGGSVSRYPRAKLVLTAPVELPLVGRVKLRETSREALLELWQRTERETGIEIRYGERVLDVRPQPGGGFEVHSSSGVHRCRNVVLALGRRGSPRRLGVEGEEHPKVVYQIEDAGDYARRRVLVVGAGDSALEAACAIAQQPGTQVTLSCRGDGFPRAKPPNRERAQALERARRLRVLRSSRVERVDDDGVTLASPQGRERIPNDAVVVCIGGELPTRFLHQVGIETEVRHGEP